VKVADAMETWHWWMAHGQCWNHPQAPGIGDQNRDIRKILHYTQGWPELLDAVRLVMEKCMGYDTMFLEATFHAARPAVPVAIVPVS